MSITMFGNVKLFLENKLNVFTIQHFIGIHNHKIELNSYFNEIHESILFDL